MSTTKLTEEQRHAAWGTAKRVYIEAAPGSGKTTVAAERFGVLRYCTVPKSTKRIVAVSFTRSAAAELRDRVSRRWGPTAVSWPHVVGTIDWLVRDIVEYLLRRGEIVWPGNITTLAPLEHWKGQKGYRPFVRSNDPKGGIRVQRATVKKGVVTSERITSTAGGITTKALFLDHLKIGTCTHQDIRDILSACMATARTRESVIKWLSTTTEHIIVDEIFDANDVDLAILQLALDALIPVTVVGDPWQALYGFRGAQPDLVLTRVTASDFVRYPIGRSFRFESDAMKHLAEKLRAGEPVSLDVDDKPDVVLATTWSELWKAPSYVLPLSFGSIDNMTIAILTVILDHVTRARLGTPAMFFREALLALGLDVDVSEAQRGAIGVVATSLADHPCLASDVLTRVRALAKELGRTRAIPINAKKDENFEKLIVKLHQRLKESILVPGMTVHQAKGRQWRSVGVRLFASQVARLSRGLNSNQESDRQLYVALTRARERTFLVEESG